VIKQANETLRAAAPYASVAARLLTAAVSIAGPASGLLLAPAVAAAIQPHSDIMKQAARAMLSGDLEAAPGTRLDPGLRRSVEGADLRALETLLESLDPVKRWGGLRPVTMENNETVWVCPEHYRKFVPDPIKTT